MSCALSTWILVFIFLNPQLISLKKKKRKVTESLRICLQCNIPLSYYISIIYIVWLSLSLHNSLTIKKKTLSTKNIFNPMNIQKCISHPSIAHEVYKDTHFASGSVLRRNRERTLCVATLTTTLLHITDGGLEKISLFQIWGYWPFWPLVVMM